MNFTSFSRILYTLLLFLVHFYIVQCLTISHALKEVPGIRYMGTKSPYVFSHAEKKTRRTKLLEVEDSSEDYKTFFRNEEWKNQCKPVHVSLVCRHGNRLPSLKNMKYIQRLVRDVQDEFALNDVRPETHDVDGNVFVGMNDWVSPYNTSQEKDLNRWGYEEIYKIADRFARNFRDLFEEDDFHHDNVNTPHSHSKREILEDIYVISSTKSRSIDSAKEFLRGLRDVIKNPFLTDAEIEYANHLTRYHSTCDKFKKIWESGALEKEVVRFMKSEDIQKIAVKVAKKLGLAGIINTPGKILGKEHAGKMLWTIMNSCYAETAHTGKVSFWCDLLEEEDFRKLSFSNDLKHYYKNTGYVEPTGGKQSCQLLEHLFDYVDKAIVGRRLRKPHKKMVLRFGHAETLIPLYSLLGLYREPQPLTADYQKHVNRVFDLSKIAPHSANLQMVLYECDDLEPAPVQLERYMVQVLVNEMEEVLPMCKYSLCSYKEVRDYYRQDTEFCDLDEICEREKKGVDDNKLVKDEL